MRVLRVSITKAIEHGVNKRDQAVSLLWHLFVAHSTSLTLLLPARLPQLFSSQRELRSYWCLSISSIN